MCKYVSTESCLFSKKKTRDETPRSLIGHKPERLVGMQAHSPNSPSSGALGTQIKSMHAIVGVNDLALINKSTYTLIAAAHTLLVHTLLLRPDDLPISQDNSHTHGRPARASFTRQGGVILARRPRPVTPRASRRRKRSVGNNRRHSWGAFPPHGLSSVHIGSTHVL